MNYEANRVTLLKLSFTRHKIVAVGDETRQLLVLALLRGQLRLSCSVAVLPLQNGSGLGSHSAASSYYTKELYCCVTGKVYNGICMTHVGCFDIQFR